MKLNKQVQAGILLCLYITRAGRITIGSSSESLGISRYFLYKIAKRLKVHNVLINIKGRNGGYELNGNPPMRDIMKALSDIRFLNSREQARYAYGGQEQRAFSMFTIKMELSLHPVTKMSIKSVMKALVDTELSQMSKKSTNEEISQ